MLSNLKRREGFTLIELMIVVAIIGILAAIAIPNFIKFQLRSKAGEGKVNLAAIRTAEESYFAEAGTYMDWVATPTAPAPGQKTPFFGTSYPGCPAAGTAWTAGSAGMCWIGWQPEGDVFYSYEVFGGALGATVAVDPTATPPVTANEFYAGAVADIDADAVLNSWGVNQPDINGVAMAAPAFTNGTVCTALGPVDSGTGAAVLGQVGPCESNDMGRNIF
ncbi:MAG TPA: prepilin-type N-terminal cleavage/methylation domain-containing protein [Myxococcota bacterium]|nr:prepilin-type N-terminal cleavage/methylation domain-containing protein [Myxococcota bacterium]